MLKLTFASRERMSLLNDTNMLLLVMFISCISAATVSTTARSTNEVILGGRKYSKELLVNLKNTFPQDVRVDRRTGNIFFISASGSSFDLPGFGSEPIFKAHVLKKGASSYQDIQGLRQESKAIGIDQVNGIIYIGTSRGLYKYDDKTTSARNYGGLPQDIIAVDVGENGKQIYYVEDATEKTHKMAADFSNHELIWDLKGAYGLTIDSQGNAYFTDFYTPYLVRANQHSRVKIAGENEFFKVADFSVGKDGKVFAINDKGDIYTVDASNAKATKLGNVGIAGETTSLAIESSGDFLIGYKYGISRVKKI